MVLISAVAGLEFSDGLYNHLYNLLNVTTRCLAVTGSSSSNNNNNNSSFILTADNPQLIYNTLPRRTAQIQSNIKNQL